MAAVSLLPLALAAQQQVKRTTPGSAETPFLPGEKWRIHDTTRPRPRVITPGTESSQQRPGRAPADAMVLFDGKDLSNWLSLARDTGELGEPKWKIENGYMEVLQGAGNLITKEKFGDCQLHLEWASPAEVTGDGQYRGNSGVFLMRRYEIQVLDSYENATYADGQAGAMYGQWPPLVNACRKPGEWQTYDIVFEAPRFKDKALVKPATATVFHNGIVLHNRQPFLGDTPPARVVFTPHPSEEPLVLQNHRGDKVRYRNIWIRRLTGYDQH
jgi:hypothetical protein